MWGYPLGLGLGLGLGLALWLRSAGARGLEEMVHGPWNMEYVLRSA